MIASLERCLCLLWGPCKMPLACWVHPSRRDPLFPPPPPFPPSRQVAKAGALLLGAQISPQLQLDELLALPLERHAWAGAARRCQQAASYAVAYQPEPGRASYGGRFTAAVELVRWIQAVGR